MSKQNPFCEEIINYKVIEIKGIHYLKKYI